MNLGGDCLDVPGVGDGETVEQVHQHHNDQEEEGEEVAVGHHTQVAPARTKNKAMLLVN